MRANRPAGALCCRREKFLSQESVAEPVGQPFPAVGENAEDESGYEIFRHRRGRAAGPRCHE